MLEQGVKFISPCFSVSVVNFKHVIAGYGTAFDLSKEGQFFYQEVGLFYIPAAKLF